MTKHDQRFNLWGFGILGGLIAGIMLGAFMMFFVAPQLGKPVMAPLNMIGAVFLGKSYLMHPSPSSILIGAMMHMILSAILGIIFASIWRKMIQGKGVEIILGLIYSFIVWLVMTYVLLPIVGSPMAKVTGGWFIVAHLIFGLVLALIIPSRKIQTE